ncbi:hypothetical protein [Abyssibacter sp.]|uniref:hypothetical protein n=1 Tax=Abyssibacter sp. TaxID=2320200 RepID=UPI003514371F
MHINSHKLVWFLVILVLASRILGAHAHACSDGDLDCLKEAHADAIAHVSEACADETCIDTKVEAADGILVKLLDVDESDLLAVVAAVLLGLFIAPRILLVAQRTTPVPRRRVGLSPPARAPPLAL